MAYGMDDRAREQISGAAGTGPFTLPNSAVPGFQAFLEAWGASGTGEAVLVIGSQWQTGFCTLNAGGTEITVTTPYDGSSGSGVAVNFTAGTMDVFGDPTAELTHHLNMREITVADSATPDIGAVRGMSVVCNGTTTITSFGTKANRVRLVRFSGIRILTHHATSLIIPGGLNITTAAGDTALLKSDASGNWRCYNYQRASGRTPTQQVFTASGTYTKPAGVTAIVVEVWGAGGSGGGVASTTSGQFAVASAGGGGGFTRRRLLTAAVGATETVTIGAGGAAPSAGNNPGNSGGTTTFGALAQATGGYGGLGGGATALPSSTNGVAGGVGSLGDENLKGHSSTPGYVQFAAALNPSVSGGAAKGSGGLVGSQNGAGATGPNYGVGGSAAANQESQAARAGGAGADGFVLVTEYYT